MKNLVILGGGYGGMKILNELLPNHLPEDVNDYSCGPCTLPLLKNRILRLSRRNDFDKEIRVSFPVHILIRIKYGEVIAIENNR